MAIMIAQLPMNSQCIGNNTNNPCCNQLTNIDPLKNNENTLNIDRTGKTFYLRLNPNDVLEKEHIMRGRKLN